MGACACLQQYVLKNHTAILSCRYGPHEKSWKIGLGQLDLKSRPSPHCWVRRNSRESTNFHFGPVEGGFPGQRTTPKAPSLHTNCNWLRPQGLKLRPQGLKAFLPNFSTKLRHLLADFDEWTLVGKLEIPAKRRRHFCSRVAKGTNDSAVFKEGTHTFGSISPNPYMQRPDQFVQGRDRGARQFASVWWRHTQTSTWRSPLLHCS